MEERDTLFTFAEFAVGLAGFAAVVVAINRRAGPSQGATRYRIEALLVASISAGLSAFVPVCLVSLGLPESYAWRAASGLYLIILGGGAWFAIARARSLPASARAEISWSLLLVVQVATVFILLLLALNAAAVFIESGPGPYVLALFLQLSAASAMFVRVVLALHD